MQDTSRLERALRAAHAAGDTQAATRLAQEIRRTGSAPQQSASDMIPTDSDPRGYVTRQEEQAQRAQRDPARQQQGTQYARDLPYASMFSPRGMAQAFNFSDELVGLSARARGLDGQAAAQEEQDRVAFNRREAPIQTGIYEMGATLPLAPFGGAGLRSAMTAGAVYGGVAGAGSGDTLEERAGNAAFGALAGAGTAGTLDRLGAGTQRLGRYATNRVRGLFGGGQDQARRRAGERLAKAFSDDGISPDAARRNMQQALSSGFDDVTLADVGGDTVRREMRRAAGQAGPGSQQAEQFAQQRISSQADRVADRIASAISDSDNFNRAVEEVISRRVAVAEPLYHQFRQLPPIRRGIRAGYGHTQSAEARISQQLDELFQNPTFAREARRARASAMARENVELRLDGQVRPGDLQRVYATLGEQIRAAKRSGDLTRRGDLTALQGRLRDLIDDAYPGAHQAARNAYAGESELLDALDAGRNILRGDAEDVADLAARMSDSEREMFRIGAVRAVRERASRVRDGRNVVDAIIGNADQRSRLRQAFDTDGDFNAFIQSLQNESDRVNNARFIRPSTGSQSTPREMDAVAAGSDLIGDITGGRPLSAAGRVGGMALDAVRGGTARARDQAIVDMGTQRLSQRMIDQIVAQVEREQGRAAAEQVRRTLMRPAIPGLAAGASSLATQPQ
ncbi:MAG: hypothetical protein VX529_11030 [Pseudomonadota bacterium]|nr:hypothetical protein [Pseudomonadota bacterium]